MALRGFEEEQRFFFIEDSLFGPRHLGRFDHPRYVAHN
jgi:hypothetical protein